MSRRPFADAAAVASLVLAQPAEASASEVARAVATAGYPISSQRVRQIRRDAGDAPRAGGRKRRPGSDRSLQALGQRATDLAARVPVKPEELIDAGYEALTSSLRTRR